MGDTGLISGSERSLRERNGNPHQYSCPEKPGRLQSIGWQKVGHDWSDLACVHMGPQLSGAKLCFLVHLCMGRWTQTLKHQGSPKWDDFSWCQFNCKSPRSTHSHTSQWHFRPESFYVASAAVSIGQAPRKASLTELSPRGWRCLHQILNNRAVCSAHWE